VELWSIILQIWAVLYGLFMNKILLFIQFVIVQLLCGLDDTQSKHTGQKWRKVDSTNLGCALLLVPLDIRPKIQNCTCALHYAVVVEVLCVVGTFLATRYCYHVPCD